MTGERWRPQYRIAEAVVTAAALAALTPLATWLAPGWRWVVITAGGGLLVLIYGLAAEAVYARKGTLLDRWGRLERIAGLALAMATGPLLLLPANTPFTFGMLTAEFTFGIWLLWHSRSPSIRESDERGRVKREVQRQLRDPLTFSGRSLAEARRVSGVFDQHPERRDLGDWAAALDYAQLIAYPARDSINGGAGPALRAWVDREREELDRERERRLAAAC